MKSKTVAARLARLGIISCSTTLLAMLGVSPAAQAADLPDLQASATADKERYAFGDDVTFAITIKNAGPVLAKNVTCGGDYEGVDLTSPFAGPKFDLAPGESKTITVKGVVNVTGRNWGRAYLVQEYTAENGEANPADNTASAHALVPGIGFIQATVVQNTTGAKVPAPGVKFVLVDQKHNNKILGEAITNANGVAKIADIPVGDYLAQFTPPVGWQYHETPCQVLGGTAGGQLYIELNPGVNTPPSTGETSSGVSGAATNANKAPIAGLTSASVSPSSTATTLAVTGSSTLLIGTIGAVMIGLGCGTYLATRRRRVRFVAGDE